MKTSGSGATDWSPIKCLARNLDFVQTRPDHVLLTIVSRCEKQIVFLMRLQMMGMENH